MKGEKTTSGVLFGEAFGCCFVVLVVVVVVVVVVFVKYHAHFPCMLSHLLHVYTSYLLWLKVKRLHQSDRELQWILQCWVECC